ncbi:MAG TPA: hypothetical protein VF601_11630 [Beijerinckiaceae bacterium]
MQQHRRLSRGLHLAAGGPDPFGGGLDGAPESACNGGHAPYVVVLDGRDEIVLKVRPSGAFPRAPLLRLDPAAARRLAGELLAFAGAIDGAPSD